MRRAGDHGAQLDRFTKRPAHEAGEIGDQLAHIGKLGIERLPPAERQQLPGELGPILGRLLRLSQQRPLLGVGQSGLEHFEVSGNHGE